LEGRGFRVLEGQFAVGAGSSRASGHTIHNCADSPRMSKGQETTRESLH